MITYPQMSSNQRNYVEYVANHPGCCVADVNRACKINQLAGHRWVYDGVARLCKQGVLRFVWDGMRKRLFLID